MTTKTIAVGTKFNTTKAILVNGQIQRVPCVAMVTGSHNYDESTMVYHADVDGLAQPYTADEILHNIVR